MGIGQWTRLSVTPNSQFCKQYNIKPGEYLFMYDLSSSRLLIQDQKTSNIVYQKYASSLRDLISVLSASLPSATDQEVIATLKRGGKPGSKAFPNHHIIPVHLWRDYQLIIEARRYGFDMNGSDNMMPVPYEIHKKCHAEDSPYSHTIRYHLRDRWNALVEAGLENDPDEIKDVLLSLIDALREDLTEIIEEEGYMDDIHP